VPPPLFAANVCTATGAGTFAGRDHHGPPVPLCVEEWVRSELTEGYLEFFESAYDIQDGSIGLWGSGSGRQPIRRPALSLSQKSCPSPG
jgi:hypothetical protein